ncbi:hypothetical protein JTE90_003080 [Oedothorax gibbosus]|uniref:Uncharacterized protein n=1 Tax=Oedothorax gibbosus TaxID=931172 RepID=A0AAV6TUS8_9ARAC|nr:hypothetical protein JTE90_003080 [Oedothorax gibbosus]
MRRRLHQGGSAQSLCQHPIQGRRPTLKQYRDPFPPLPEFQENPLRNRRVVNPSGKGILDPGESRNPLEPNTFLYYETTLEATMKRASVGQHRYA